MLAQPGRPAWPYEPLSPQACVWGLYNAALVTIFGFELAGLIGGSIFVETLLGIPGMGLLFYESVTARNYDVMMAIVLLGTTIFVFAMLAVDIAYGFIDPRVRLGGASG